MFNCIKLKNDLHNKNIKCYHIAKKLNISTRHIYELVNGIENDKLLTLICDTYNLNKQNYYMNDFVEPEYITILRQNLKYISSYISYKQLSKNVGISYQSIVNIINKPSCVCHVNMANKINNYILNFDKQKMHLKMIQLY